MTEVTELPIALLRCLVITVKHARSAAAAINRIPQLTLRFKVN
jgi:hypothetical protein